MNVRRGGLGRGLGALIPTGPSEDAIEGARFEEVDIDSIEPNPRQPRDVFDAEALAELVTSIREVGILQPVVVREVDPGRYQLVMGERRWRASREAGLTVIPAIVRETADDALLRDALLENLHRQELNALEEAAAYAQLLEEFGATHEELAERIGRSRSHVTNTLRLMNLPPSVQRRVAAGVLSAGHARALLSLDNADAQEQLASRAVAEGLSVRAVEEIVALGQSERPTPTARTKRPVAPAVAALAESLSESLETRVAVELGRRRGKIVIQFGSLDDLERIAGLLGVDAHVTAETDLDGSDSPGAALDGGDDHGGDGHGDEHGGAAHEGAPESGTADSVETEQAGSEHEHHDHEQHEHQGHEHQGHEHQDDEHQEHGHDQGHDEGHHDESHHQEWDYNHGE